MNRSRSEDTKTAASDPAAAHVKARRDHPAYLEEGVRRIPVPDGKVAWDVPWPDYDLEPQEPYLHGDVLGELDRHGDSGWAAAPEARMTADRVTSYVPNLPVSDTGEVLNPGGRTGIKDGRGLLGQPGPNFAADPVIFRLQGSELQLLVIQRQDTGEWALPGGMVDRGETVTRTLKRELEEETGVALSMDDVRVVYRGYVDDPRNTDKAWMETTAAWKLLDGPRTSAARLEAGDDARAARWAAVDRDLLSNLYASHGDFIRRSLRELSRIHGDRLPEVRELLAELLGRT